MSQQLETLLNLRYEVRSPEPCTVTDAAGMTVLSASPGTPAYFVADGRPVTLSSDAATMLPAHGVVVVESGGAASAEGFSATGEPIVALSSAELTVQHATWFDNAEQSAITVTPATWQNEVMTCYLKTAVPVAFSGVQWLYGEPYMGSGYIYVIALQQIDAATVLANLAYSLPR